MRWALFTLIKRQFVDNAIYFAAALLVSLVLIIITISVVLSESLTHLSVYALAHMFITPVLFYIGSYTFGLIQTYNDRINGITAMLTILPAKVSHILLARIVTGASIILVLLGPVAITGAVLWKLLGPSHWLFHGWVADVFIGLLLTALSCYCLGLYTGQKSETFASALRSLPLVLILMLLIPVKGFGLPLLIVLLPFLAVSLLRCRQPPASRHVTTAATGFMVLVLLAVPLYFARHFSNGGLRTTIDATAVLSPSGLVPPEIENTKNTTDHSKVSGSYWGRDNSIIDPLFGYNWASELLKEIFYILEPLGITEYFRSREHGERRTYFRALYESPIYYIHLGLKKGQLIYRITESSRWGDVWQNEFPWNWNEYMELRAGPEGVSAVQNQELGRFGAPIVYFGSRDDLYMNSLPRCIVYDAMSRCFFNIDFDKSKVHKGPTIQDTSIRPISIGEPTNPDDLLLRFDIPSHMGGSIHRSTDYLPVIGESGRIDLLDPNTLELQGPAGYLTRPRTLFGRSSPCPRDLMDYDVKVICIEPYKGYPIDNQLEEQYLGLAAASLSPQGMWTSVAVFDKEGNEIKTSHSKTAFFNKPGGPVFTMMKYLFESLHPPALTLASYFTAHSFEARSTHRALFLMPNSFVAMARDFEGNIFWTILLVLVLMLPALLFSGLFGLRVARDAAILGLSNNARRLWLLGTLAFGLPAYITYRLSRPKITLITCANCGKPRRPDQNICHQCGSPWHVPELTPPAWRMLDRTERVSHNSSAKTNTVE